MSFDFCTSLVFLLCVPCCVGLCVVLVCVCCCWSVCVLLLPPSSNSSQFIFLPVYVDFSMSVFVLCRLSFVSFWYCMGLMCVCPYFCFASDCSHHLPDCSHINNFVLLHLIVHIIYLTVHASIVLFYFG